jgi:hypothetical protein
VINNTSSGLIQLEKWVNLYYYRPSPEQSKEVYSKTNDIQRIDDYISSRLRKILSKFMGKNWLQETLHNKTLWLKRL